MGANLDSVEAINDEASHAITLYSDADSTTADLARLQIQISFGFIAL